MATRRSCSKCGGRGWVINDNPPTIDCPVCKGKGDVEDYRVLRVPLPPMFKKPKTDQAYYVFWGTAVTSLMLLAIAIILELRSIHLLLLERL